MTFSICARDQRTGQVGVGAVTAMEEFEQQLVPQVRKMSTRQDYVGPMTREQMEQE